MVYTHNGEYFNQEDLAREISYRFSNSYKYSMETITNILKYVGIVIKDKISTADCDLEFKPFSGLKITAEYVPTSATRAKNLGGRISSKDSLILKAVFTDDFKKNVRKARRHSL